MKLQDRRAYTDWEKFRKQVYKDTFIDLTETPIQKNKRIAKLEGDFEKWAEYYFPNYYKAKAAGFQKAASKRWIENEKWYEVRAWSRELAKSTRAMMEDLYLMLTKRAFVKLLISNSEDNAVRLLTPYKINLESNQRIINDYGEQKGIGQWEQDYFVSKMGFASAGLGAGQSPRGFRMEEIRPDILDFDDLDTDEDCRNPTQIKKKWDWVEQAAIPTVSISGRKRIRFNGNIIAKYCCITEAIKRAKHVDIINIRDKNGRSTWPEKNSEEDIDFMLSIISYISQQKEYFNNPISEGTVFKEMHYKKMPPLEQYRFLVTYIDLSYKSSLKNDYKAAVLMGKWKDEYHVLKCWLKQGTTSALAAGLVELQNYVGGRAPLYFVAEENFLQDIIRKQLHEDLKSLGSSISITPDNRKKPEKFFRIESTIEPLNTNGKFFLNIEEKDNPSMQTLDEQFRVLEPGSKAHDDGPDACEGAKHTIDGKLYVSVPPKIGGRTRNSKRF